MLLLGIANCAGDEVKKVSLPEVGPAVEREQVYGGGAEAVGADGGEHACASGIPALDELGAVAVLFAGPIEFRGGAGETVEDRAIAGGHLFENATNESVAGRRGDIEVDRRRRDREGGLVSVVDRGG
jgi:hypothetical protein